MIIMMKIFLVLNFSLGNTTQPIWLTSVDCSIIDNCLASCQSCPTEEVTSCSHSKDTSVQCSEYISSSFFFFIFNHPYKLSIFLVIITVKTGEKRSNFFS